MLGYGVSQVALVVKNLPASARNTENKDLIPGLGTFVGEGNGNPLQYCLENSLDRRDCSLTVHRTAESDMTEHTHKDYFKVSQSKNNC